jgi:hypothetical protein
MQPLQPHSPSPPPPADHAAAAPPNVERETLAIKQVEGELRRVIVGQDYRLDRLLVGLLARGPVLIEGVPGLAKTLAVKTLASTLHLDFQRIQFTPDLLPADLVGTLIYDQRSGEFQPRQGPIFNHIVLADEINRAPAKVQSALLESMEERQVTLGDTTYPLEDPFMVLATQNPIEQEGTYPLAEAQIDRFQMKLKLTYPSRAEEEVGEDRALPGVEVLGALVVDQGADEVCGKEVGGELDALEVEVEGAGQRLDRQRLGQPRHALDQHVAAGEEADQQAVEQVVLPDDHPPQLALDLLDRQRLAFHVRRRGGDVIGGRRRRRRIGLEWLHRSVRIARAERIGRGGGCNRGATAGRGRRTGNTGRRGAFLAPAARTSGVRVLAAKVRFRAWRLLTQARAE